MINTYENLSTKYKLKFFNFFLQQFLQKQGGYNLDHDDMIYKLSNFGAKVRPNFISFSFGVREQDIYSLLDMLTSYDFFDIQNVESTIVKIYFPFNEEKIKELKYKRSKSESQKKLKQMILNCYRRMKDIQYNPELGD